MDIETRPVIACYPQESNDCDIVGDLFVLRAMQEFGFRIVRGSAVGFIGTECHEKMFRDILEYCLPIRHAVEIGTWRGLSTAILAHYADKVTTIDIVEYSEATNLWVYAGVADKIHQSIVTNDYAKAQVIEDLDFDFAFIDAVHEYENVMEDFEMVRKCGRVLFHDYCDEFPGVKQAVDEIGKAIVSPPFALWRFQN